MCEREKSRAVPHTGRRTGRRELATFFAVYLLYDAARWVFAARSPPARAHARWLVHLERALHIDVEGSIQRAFTWRAATVVLSNVYLAAQLVVLPFALIFLYRRSPEIYRRLRRTVIATWCISVPIYAVFPVAPPRLAGIGIHDTVSHQAGLALTGHSTMFYNPYAAVPSLHVGFAVGIGVALSAALDRSWAKALALTWGPLVALAVIATGNHFVIDVTVGVLVLGLAFVLTELSGRTARARGRVPWSRRLVPGSAGS